jgi:hypothetical protein
VDTGLGMCATSGMRVEGGGRVSRFFIYLGWEGSHLTKVIEIDEGIR